MDMAFLVAELLMGAAGAWLVSRHGGRIGLVDMPNERSSHYRPTPKGGGIGVVLSFVAVSVFWGLPAGFYLPPTALSLFSLLGDRVDIRPVFRLLVQFSAAFLVLAILDGLASHSMFGALLSGGGLAAGIAFILASIFVVGTANFYNFMDGINGIAAITAIVGFGLLAAYGTVCQKDARIVMLCLGLAAACAGFLPFNVPKAKVFMGDVGSVLLGFVFAIMVLAFSADLMEFALLAGFLFPFYADELITMVERIAESQSLAKPHRRHLYQVLANEAGIAHWQVATGYGVLQLVGGIIFWQASEKSDVIFYIALAIAIIFFLMANNKIKSLYLHKT